MKFQIKDPNGNILFASFEETETIQDIKQQIESVWNIPVCNQILITRSSPIGSLDPYPSITYLSNEKKISEYEINNHIIYLFYKLMK